MHRREGVAGLGAFGEAAPVAHPVDLVAQLHHAERLAVADEHALGFTDAVLLAVSPDRRILAARESGPFGIEAALTRWRDAVALAGASEIHVHLLAEDGISRRAALLDLMPEV